jgi:hypothetical protein
MSDSFVMLGVEAKQTRVNVRAYMIAQDSRVLKGTVIVGPEQTCVAVFANLNQEGSHIYVDDYHTTRCEFFYRRLVAPLPCKWIAMCILSKDPRCIWNDSDQGLIEGIKRTTETPFLECWLSYLRGRMVQEKKLTKLIGHHSRGSLIDCNTEDLDKLVVQGIQSKSLTLEVA